MFLLRSVVVLACVLVALLDCASAYDAGSAYRNQRAFAAIRTGGIVQVWGDITKGGAINNDAAQTQLNLGGVSSITSTASSFCALKGNGAVVYWGADQSYDPTDIKLSTGVSKVYANNLSFAALKGDTSVVSWGSSLGSPPQ